MVDAEDLRFPEMLAQVGIELARGVEIASERLFDDHAAVAVGRLPQQSGLAELGRGFAEKGRRDREIENGIAPGNGSFRPDEFQFLPDGCECGRIVEVAAHVKAPADKPLPLRGINRAEGEIPYVLAQLSAEGLVVARGDGHAEHGESLGQEAEATQVEQGRDELAFGQVARCPENDEHARRARGALQRC